jgi:predicted DCC family thiol-disulfide oxidoreductase YuxK
MVDSPRQASSDGQGVHLVLYDGMCGFCNRLLQLLLVADHRDRAVFDFASLQSATGRAIVESAGGHPEELNSFYVSANYRTPKALVITRGEAALFVAGELGWPWKLTSLIRALPSAWLDRAYDLVARNRYRIFGRDEQCLAPRPEFRNRFVE